MDNNLIGSLLQLPIFHAEWVLWLLLGLSLVTIVVTLERWFFYRNRRVNVHELHRGLMQKLSEGDFDGAARLFNDRDTLEATVMSIGIQEYLRGPEAVEELLSGAAQLERERYEKRLQILATIASNSPFIGLFGTVLGIIRAFNDLAKNMSEASTSVMSGIAESLIATAIGLLVAIPAVIAYNFFKAKAKTATVNATYLAKALLAVLKTETQVNRNLVHVKE